MQVNSVQFWRGFAASGALASRAGGACRGFGATAGAGLENNQDQKLVVWWGAAPGSVCSASATPATVTQSVAARI